jgi:hypothetical protein
MASSASRPKDYRGCSIVVDNREGRGCTNISKAELCAQFTDMLGTPSTIMVLATGDFLLVDAERRVLVIAERKTYADAISSIRSGHMAMQLTQMGMARNMHFDGLQMPADPKLPQIVMLLVGSAADELANDDNAELQVVGMLSRAQTNYTNLVVLPVSCDELLPRAFAAHCARTIEALQPSYTGYPTVDELQKRCRKPEIDSPALFTECVVALVPGIGPKSAPVIARAFGGSLHTLVAEARRRGIHAFITDRKIAGVGKVTAEKLCAMLVASTPDEDSDDTPIGGLKPPAPPGSKKKSTKTDAAGAKRSTPASAPKKPRRKRIPTHDIDDMPIGGHAAPPPSADASPAVLAPPTPPAAPADERSEEAAGGRGAACPPYVPAASYAAASTRMLELRAAGHSCVQFGATVPPAVLWCEQHRCAGPR